MKKKNYILLFLILTATSVFPQRPQFSLATDFSVLRSFKKQQQYWSIGQTVAGHFHFTSKDGIYAWLSYYTNGKFSNSLIATAKSGAISPQQIAYTNRAKMNFKHISLGWKHYLEGAFTTENKWNLYGLIGLGLMLGRIENTHSATIDSANYTVPVLAGKANFKRLTLDLGLGYEKPLGGDVYFYIEGRALIPTTDYPSSYIFVNKDAPFTASVNLGLRILF